jgi:hypothetical protein
MRAHPRYFLLITLAFLFLGGCGHIRGVVDGEDGAKLSPKLIWWKSFEEVIHGVGVDEDHFETSGGSVDSSLRWVVLGRGPKGQPIQTSLWWFDEGRRLRREPTKDFPDYFVQPLESQVVIVSRMGESIREYRLLDSGGKEVWRIESELYFTPYVWRDGSAVLVWNEWERRHVTRTFARFLADDGSVVTEDTIGSSTWPGHISENFFMLVGGGRGRIYSRQGEILLEQEFPRQVPVLITDSGLTLFAVPADTREPLDGKTFVYNLDGTRRDTIPLALRCVEAYAFGDTVFGGSTRFWGYDLKGRKRFLALTPEKGYHFGACDVDLGRRLVAVAVHKYSEYPLVFPRSEEIKVYDFGGRLLSGIPAIYGAPNRLHLAYKDPTPPPFRLLGGRLLFYEGQGLKLYDLGLD